MPTATQTPPDYDALDDAQLLKRYVDHRDERAFAELYERRHRKLVHFITGQIGDRDTAEDLVQDSWTQVHRHAHRFDPDRSRFSTWLYTIARNLAKNELRSRGHSHVTYYQRLRDKWNIEEGDDRGLEFSDFSFTPDKGYQRRQLKGYVEEAVEQLPEHHRVVFVLREMEGKSYDEITEMTGAASGTVKSRLSRARSQFADAIRGNLARADLSELELPDVEPPREESVDLNTADLDALCTLPEVGPVRGQEIIDNRPLESVAELGQLTGFSTEVLKRVRPLVTLSASDEPVAA